MSNSFIQIDSVIAIFISIGLGMGINLNPVKAVTIPLANSGFELPEQTNEPIPGAGFFDFDTPSGWDLYDPNNLIPVDASLMTSFTGGWKPSSVFFATIPEGDQIGSIFLVPPGAGEVGFAQNAGVILQPKTVYTLSAAVLNTPGLPGAEVFEGFPGYRLELLAGNTVISTDNNTLAISEGDFKIATVSYTSSKNDIYLGETLSIRLINPNLNNNSGLNGGNGVEVNFDDVKLSAVSVPESTSLLAYMALALIPIQRQKLKK